MKKERKKRMDKMKKMARLILVLVMVLAMAVPAMADDVVQTSATYTITIKHSASGHTYQAYQIFSGRLDDGTLSDIVWGSGVDTTKETELMAALKEINAFEDCKSASEIAEVLGKITEKDAELTKKFADVVSKYLSTVCVESDAGTKDEEKNSYKYEISGLEAGYYLVKDKDDSVTGNDSYTRYILKVVDNKTVNHKGEVPQVEKNIVVDDENKKADDYNIGDTIHYEITGTLPTNYADYKSYKYEFVDTMSKGLTYNNDAKVFVVNNGKEDVEVNEFFTITPTQDTDSKTKLTITCDDLKTINKEGLTIDADSKIVVKYTATLNEHAVIGSAGNPNDVILIFSNNPNYDGIGEKPTGETPKDEVIVFTYELDVTKTDNKAENEATKLQGAEFVLYREVENENSTDENDKTIKEYVKVDGNRKVTGWTTERVKASTLTSDANGLFKIIGLDEGTYYLEETKAPAGYNLLTEPIKIVVTATIENKALTALKISVDDKNETNGDVTTGVVSTTVVNVPGSKLPETGGMGTTLFYVVGGALVAGAVVVMLLKKRNAA